MRRRGSRKLDGIAGHWSFLSSSDGGFGNQLLGNHVGDSGFHERGCRNRRYRSLCNRSCGWCEDFGSWNRGRG
jgi:hypothetical protein